MQCELHARPPLPLTLREGVRGLCAAAHTHRSNPSTHVTDEVAALLRGAAHGTWHRAGDQRPQRPGRDLQRREAEWASAAARALARRPDALAAPRPQQAATEATDAVKAPQGRRRPRDTALACSAVAAAGARAATALAVEGAPCTRATWLLLAQHEGYRKGGASTASCRDLPPRPTIRPLQPCQLLRWRAQSAARR